MSSSSALTTFAFVVDNVAAVPDFGTNCLVDVVIGSSAPIEEAAPEVPTGSEEEPAAEPAEAAVEENPDDAAQDAQLEAESTTEA